MPNHIMLDLETMCTGPNAAVVAIGAVIVDVENEGDQAFYRKISLASSVRHGGQIDPETVLWWLQQSEAARAEIVNNDTPMIAALISFASWVGAVSDSPTACIWGNGSDFDNVILSNAYFNADLRVPWRYHNNRCYRTVKNLYPHIKPPERQGTHHNALDDARHQAAHLREILKYLEQPHV